MLTTAEKAFEGACDTLQGVCAGTGVKASEPPLLSMSAMLPVHCQASPLCLSPFVCFQLPQVDSWRAHMTSFGAGHGPDWWMLYWGGGGADRLSKQTLENGSLSQCWVTSLERSALRLLLAPLQLFFFGLWRVAQGSLQANEQQLTVLQFDYTVCSTWLLPALNNELSCSSQSWNDEMCIIS